MLSLYLSLLETEQDKKQFSCLYETHLDWMIQISYHYLKNEDDAKDAVHEIFLDIAKSGKLPPLGSFQETRAYLFICIRNRATRIIEKRSKIKTASLNEFYNISSDYNLESDAINKDIKESLLSYISTMPNIYKDVLTLHFVSNFSLKEIASILGEPFKTIEARFRRGKMLIKEKFKDLDI